MKILFTIPAPKELYMFRVIGKLLEARGHEISYLIRDYGPNREIAEYFDLSAAYFGKNFSGLIGKSAEVLYNDCVAINMLKRIRPDLVIGDIFLGHVSKALRTPSIAFVDGDSVGLWYYIYLFLYLSDVFITPKFSRLIVPGRRVIKYPGFQELTYLSSKYHSSNCRILKLLGISDDAKIVILRLSSLSMSHDVFLSGLKMNYVMEIVSRLSEYATVLILSEKTLPRSLNKFRVNLPPYYIHDLLQFSALFVGETAMAVEAALLGTPTILVSPLDRSGFPFFRNYGGFSLCEEKGLLRMMAANDISKIVKYSTDTILNNVSAKETLATKVKALVQVSIDVASFAAWFIGNYPQSLCCRYPQIFERFKFEMT
jgi:hypothetical protein